MLSSHNGLRDGQNIQKTGKIRSRLRYKTAAGTPEGRRPLVKRRLGQDNIKTYPEAE